jgi:hypothetical protein
VRSAKRAAPDFTLIVKRHLQTATVGDSRRLKAYFTHTSTTRNTNLQGCGKSLAAVRRHSKKSGNGARERYTGMGDGGGERDRCVGYVHNLQYPGQLLTFQQLAHLGVNNRDLQPRNCSLTKNSFNNMCRPNCQTISWQEELQDPRQQYISIDGLKSFFWRHGRRCRICT